MDVQSSQDTVAGQSAHTVPATPEPHRATLAVPGASSAYPTDSRCIGNASQHLTPPPSSQQRGSSQRRKTRTPTPPISQISTPPPTVEMPSQNPHADKPYSPADSMTAEQIAAASAEELRATVMELQAALQEARMSAAHHKLQYQMLAQESTAAVERMAVEARMVQYENDVLHSAEHAKAAASASTPAHPSPLPEGTIPVQKDLYQRMCSQIQQLVEERHEFVREQAAQDKLLQEQEYQIERLNDKISLLRERIRENRDNQRIQLESTPHSIYTTPLRHGVASHEQPQPFAALLQASEMASQEARRPGGSFRKGHARNAQSLSSLPVTPSRGHNQAPSVYLTPQSRPPPFKIPATAPRARTTTNALHDSPGIFTNSRPSVLPAPASEGTVTASEHNDHENEYGDDIVDDDNETQQNDSEAETDVVEPEPEPDAAFVNESQASRAASSMLRALASGAREAHLQGLQGRGMLANNRDDNSNDRSFGSVSFPAGKRLHQTTLFGNVRKHNASRSDDGMRPEKKQRLNAEKGGSNGGAIGLGIAGVRH